MTNSLENSHNFNEYSSDYLEELEESLLNLKMEKYILRLYVADNSPKSVRALKNITKICDEHLSGNYELEVIDIYKNQTLLEEEQIFAIPTLVKKLPPPFQKLIGDLSNTEKVIVCLDL